ncbi:Npun_R2821/Npun_R2822 family protein [Leptolyngbya sp. NIES-2104]|uniref:Npun_R2821/Npun_R2822 family protein n=1 Tax=Leptolyngbya sp. NIES-2104 TaxID=1552121 RepID=UPI0006EC5BA6|nr:Npun_R2821/Npun_R2822 family protein [Leptolyngbya sp. NIES-2104]GAP95716.1 methionine synthase II [Leptolyngbya sp. NIES-2104]
MSSRGIYTLANDAVYDQFIGLINSIEANVSPEIPIYVIPYNQHCDRVKREIDTRKNVIFYENKESIDRWDAFTEEVWAAHPITKQASFKRPKWYKSPLMRKMTAFDGPAEEFVFYDADSLAMQPLDKVFAKLREYDFVFDDWEHAKATPVAAFDFSLVQQDLGLLESEARTKIHCSSFFGSKRGLLNAQDQVVLKQHLIQNQEIAWINEKSWWCDADLFSYLTLRLDRPTFNFTLSTDGQDRTGNCANIDPFVVRDHLLYNKDGLKPIHRLHYMGYSSIEFARLSQGEAVQIPYAEVFLHYRFLKNPVEKPRSLKSPSPVVRFNRFMNKAATKVSATLENLVSQQN